MVFQRETDIHRSPCLCLPKLSHHLWECYLTEHRKRHSCWLCLPEKPATAAADTVELSSAREKGVEGAAGAEEGSVQAVPAGADHRPQEAGSLCSSGPSAQPEQQQQVECLLQGWLLLRLCRWKAFDAIVGYPSLGPAFRHQSPFIRKHHLCEAFVSVGLHAVNFAVRPA